MIRWCKTEIAVHRLRLIPYGIAIAVAVIIGVGIAAIVGMLAGPDDALIIQVVPVDSDDQIQVQIVGAVAHPGVYSVPNGSTLSDVIGLAGGSSDGALPDGLDPLSELSDGQFILVPSSDALADPALTMIDINAATAVELESLPGIGPVIAERVVQHRAAIGGFTSIDQLADVNGISTRMVEEIRSRVVVKAP